MTTSGAVILVAATLVLSNVATWRLSRSWALMTRNRRTRKSVKAELRIIRKVVRSQLRAVVLAGLAVAAFGALALTLTGTIGRT